MKRVFSLTVRDLLEILSYYPEDSHVVVASPTGDQWNTVKALEIHNVVLERVQWSQYHGSWRRVDDEEEFRDEGKEHADVVLLS